MADDDDWCVINKHADLIYSYTTSIYRNMSQSVEEYKGWLYKWTNYIKGYQKRWFVLHNSMLSYYRSQAEMAHTCRGTINLLSASIYTADSTTFVVSSSGTQSFYLKAQTEIERQKWVTALELAKDRAINLTESDSDDEVLKSLDKNELAGTIKNLTAKLEDLNTCNDLIAKHGQALLKSLGSLDRDLAASRSSVDSDTSLSRDLSAHYDPEVNRESPLYRETSVMKTINERATLFRITATAMINTCSDFLELAQKQGHRWQVEHDQKVKLEEMIEQLAKQQAAFENKIHQSRSELASADKTGSDDDEDDDVAFMDAVDTLVDEFVVALPASKDFPAHKRFAGDGQNVVLDIDRTFELSDSDDDNVAQHETREAKVLYSKKSESTKPVVSRDSFTNLQISPELTDKPEITRKDRRLRIAERPNISLNIWSILKNCIGKELSKIPMPVNFNEPLSLLQRLTEELEYSSCLDTAARCDDLTEQMVYVAAYTVSSYSTTANKSYKPFNPLLGETYECDRRDDFGWRYISEQVSHHPPIASTYAEGNGWVLSQEFSMTSRFRGRCLQVNPLGVTQLKFQKTGHLYTWRKVTSTVHNIIIGRLWIDNHGDMEIVNHTSGEKCLLKFNEYSYFSREVPRKVTGVITDSSGAARWIMTGTWDNHMEAAKVQNCIENIKGKPVFETGPHKTVWKRKYPPPEYERMYNMTSLAVQLNELEEGVAPTDSRLRPDQRLMEDCKWDEANSTKHQLEEKQRARRRRREVEAEAAFSQGLDYPEYQPVWFRKEMDPITNSLVHTFQHDYWKCKEADDWSRCPDIFAL